MAANLKNVNIADINSAPPGGEALPLDIMGLFFFAYRDFTGDADALLGRQGFGRAHHRVLYFVNLRPGMPVADRVAKNCLPLSVAWSRRWRRSEWPVFCSI